MLLLPESATEVADAADRGEHVEFLFFWGHKAQPDGSVGSGCLSQWWPAPFTIDGLVFATAEHYMMWRKAALFCDEQVAGQILTAARPDRAKALGRQVRGFDQATWEAHRFGIVVDASTAKFGQNPELREYLLATDDKVLVEASPRDRVWGIGLAAGNERAQDPASWRGLNLLGFALMHARSALGEGAAAGQAGGQR